LPSLRNIDALLDDGAVAALRATWTAIMDGATGARHKGERRGREAAPGRGTRKQRTTC